ncbi:ArsR/SmtB family transcription factor [Streptomyces sp. NPDC050421]|uniref:ArsR/SmtB family transcription factor n=1 Tax=Streptomyces sp. NPDC050421 TaxID=3365613 RepID=UPI003799CAA7
MLRIHFTTEDLGRVRLAQQPDDLWETILSLHQLVEAAPFFAPWSRQARGALAAAGVVPDARMLATLAPPSSYFPDFLTPPVDLGRSTDLGTGIDRVLSTSKRRLRTDTNRLAADLPSPPSWLDDIASGRPSALRRLGTGLRRYHACAVAPHAAASATCVGHDWARLTRRALEHGAESVLTTLGPTFRWNPPVLETDYPVEQDLHLDGRGLMLVPSFFGIHRPVTLADGELPPVLISPVTRGPLWIPQTAPGPCDGMALDELLGPSRATVLRCLDVGQSTTTLAARSSISLSMASRHAAALRRAGLVATERMGSSVLHTRTALGTALVHGG